MGQADSLDARAYYQQEKRLAESAISELQAKSATMVWVRAILFVIAAASLVLGYFGEFYPDYSMPLGWIAGFGFFVAIVRHEALRLARINWESNEQLYVHLLARLDRNWEAIKDVQLLPEFESVIYTDDLDIGGDASLLSLVSLTGTEAGTRTLQQWLLTAPNEQQFRQRQKAVQLLVKERKLRLEIVNRIRSTDAGVKDIYGLPAWGKSADWLPQHRAAHFLSYVAPTLTIIGLLAWFLLLGSEQRIWINSAACVVGAGLLLSLLLTIVWGGWIHDIFQKVTGEHKAVFEYASVFEMLGQLPDDDGLLSSAKRAATEGNTNAVKGFRELTREVRLANFQADPTMYVVYLALQLFVVWDFRILRRLEQWKGKYRDNLEEWFDSLGVCEAVICGATLADEYPDWCYPSSKASNGLIIESKTVGHPLLTDDIRVTNDFSLEDNNPLLLVTGSNMAGKSTFLRAFGLNVLLGRIGSSVCATKFDAPLFELATSIRVRDSLKDGVSFFRAELNRLKEVVDQAQKTQEERKTDPEVAPILFLLDEILQGTNSRERQIAVATVLDRLMGYGAVGCISTHDLDLASAPEVEKCSQVVHFREFFEVENEQEVMKFDYKMRAGPTPTTNALKLLEIVGLSKK